MVAAFMTKPYLQHNRSIQTVSLFLCICFASAAWSGTDKAQQARESLSYGTILYEFYQRDFFRALVNDAQVRSQGNSLAIRNDGRLLQGGMQLSYGLPDAAKTLFERTLNDSQSDVVRNAAWYYLAKLYYAKSDLESAREALSHIQGAIGDNLHVDYHYLSSLIGSEGIHTDENRDALSELKDDLPEYPYFLFNFAVQALTANRTADAQALLRDVQSYSHLGSEYEVLSDRAKHGLAILASSEGRLLDAWHELSRIRTTGIYSNRALLSYAWAAIKLKRYKDAIPALQILDERSIALPEVQEGKVLLAHLYEQDQLPRKALKQNIVAEQEFAKGLLMLDEAERIIEMKDVPREFIANLENVVRETDWYGERPEVDYKQLTPFLIDLTAAHSFNEVLRELSDLYALKENINYWLLQEEQHLLILEESERKDFGEQTQRHIQSSEDLKVQLTALDTELRLMLLSLEQEEQDRFETQLESIGAELLRVDDRLKLIKTINEPYRPPAHLAPEIIKKQKQLAVQLEKCNEMIERLEHIVRDQVKHELGRHRSRMTYYAAQARLAKARLYDATLQDLNSARNRTQKSTLDAGEPDIGE